MANILLACSSVYGHTQKICEKLKSELKSRGFAVDIVDLSAGVGDIARYDVVVVGASVRHGKHRPEVIDFIREHRELLGARPGGLFSVSLVARKPDKNTPETNPYARNLLARIPWRPQLVGVFAGNVDYPRYGVFDRTIIRIIMWLTNGPTDPTARIEFTDWDAVKRFGGQIAALAGEA